MRHARLALAGLAGCALLTLAVPTAASAHVSVTPNGTAAGSSSVLTFAFSHGCDGSPTTALTFEIPESIDSVSPTMHPGWTIDKVDEGDRTSQVVYTALTPVEDGFRDTIQLSVRLPEDAAGETLAFPVLQTCVAGETNWNQVAEDGEAEPESPAPTILVTEATGDEHGHGDDTADPADADHNADVIDDHGTDDTTGTTDAAAASDTDDTVARVLGIGGLAVGVVSIVLALTARRGATRKP